MVKKDKIKNLFTGTVRRDKYKWLLPISAHLIRALNIQENSKYDIGVDADQNKIIFKFRKKPIGFLGYRLNLIDEFKKVDKPLMEKEIDKNIENSKKVLSDKPLKYLYTDTGNQAEIKNLKQCIKWCKGRLTFLNTLEEGKQLYKEEYQKKKLSKLKNKQL